MSIAFTTDSWLQFFITVGMPQDTAAKWAPAFGDTIKDNTFSKGKADLVDFLATILHESQMLQKMRESGKYRPDRIRQLGMASAPGSRWRSLVDRADELGSTPNVNNETRFFEAVYGGRMGNGPEGSGEGQLYAGTGPLGVTGLDNFLWLANRVGQDVTMMPQLLMQPHFGLEFCISWWEGRVPDSILGDERKVRKVVNGGDFGLQEVRDLLNRIANSYHLLEPA